MQGVGIGLVIRNELGTVFSTKQIPCKGMFMVKEAEAYGMLLALKWVSHLL